MAVVLLAWPVSASSVEDPTLRIVEIELEGLNRTQPHVVLRELLFGVGDEVTIDDVEESVQRLRNMAIFSNAEYEFEAIDEENARILIIADERWTILPILQFSFGGDITRTRLGLYDLNILGRYLELGGEYQNIAGANSFGVWFREPRLFGDRIRLETEAWVEREIVLRYDLDGEPLGGFMGEHEYGVFFLEPELSRRIRVRFGARFGQTSFSLRGVSDDARVLQAAEGLLGPAWIGRLMAGLTLGKIDERDYRRHGETISGGIELNRSLGGVEIGYVEPSLEVLFFRELPLRSNFGLRLTWRGTTADRPEFNKYVGGLDHIRGYRNSRFSGRAYWNGNVEYRIPSVDHRYFVLQHVVFADAVAVADDLVGLANVTAASAGFGVRVIVPAVYGLILRFDLALPVGAPGESFFNAGSLQFF